MPKPFGSQKNFDRNGDGRLSSNEYFDWYTAQYGIDIENSERRAVQNEVNTWTSWLSWATFCVDNNYERFIDNAHKFFSPWSPEIKQLVGRVYVGWITIGLSSGNVLNTTVKTTSAGFYYPNKIFHPYRSLINELAARHSDLCSARELEVAALSKKVLYYEDCYLSENGYGVFWDKLFSVLPPYQKNVLHSARLKAFSIVPELEPIRHLVEGIISTAALFSGKSGEENDDYIDHFQNLFIGYWKERCGEKVSFEEQQNREYFDEVLSNAQTLLCQFSSFNGNDEIRKMPVEEIKSLCINIEDIIDSLITVEPEDTESEEWFTWSDCESQLDAILTFAQDYEIDLEEKQQKNSEGFEPNENENNAENDDKIYTICSVYIEWLDKNYSYLPPETSVNIGDRVAIPIGWKNRETTGIVENIKPYCASDVPYPIKKMKRIIRILPPESN